MRRSLALALVLLACSLVGASGASAASLDLYLSEYVEGTGNSKAVEIYNGTGAAVNLATGGYSIQMFFNGSSSAGVTINLTGTVADGDVYVLAQSAADPAILAVADQTNGAGWFNGDDAVVLRKGATVIDVIGQIGVDPGSEWGSGDASTADNTLRRKATITAGDPNGADAFDPSVEWDGFPTNTFAGSVAEIAALPAVPCRTESDAGHETTTPLWPPSPANVFVANPSHSTDGSKTSEPFESPAVIAALRRSVLSAVLASPDPHSVPGSKPIWPITSSTVVPLRSTTASSPLNQPAPFVWSATARIDAFALACATTKTSSSATVPVRLIVRPAVAEPLKNIWTL